MYEKIVIVTGANSGIGKETALSLAKQGATVVMVCRNQARGSAALNEIKQASGSENVHLMLCDMGSFASIRAFATQFKAQYDRLDVLVNNAGLMNSSRQETVDGIETTFAVNHLGYFLTTMELLDLLQASAPARIVNVASAAHDVGTFNFDDYQRTKKYSAFQVYGESKMANILFTRELARRLADTGVTVNAVHPGFVATNFATNNGLLYKVGMRVVGRIFGRNTQHGAETSIHLASSPDVEGITGEYYADKKITKTHPFAEDVAAQKQLWELSEQLVSM
ncbi:MAG: SDR family oxidoreductase [Candidatus Promineifilaceae bacterium]